MQHAKVVVVGQTVTVQTTIGISGMWCLRVTRNAESSYVCKPVSGRYGRCRERDREGKAS